MSKFSLMGVVGILLCSAPAYAQFNTITTSPGRYRIEVLEKNTDIKESVHKGAAPTDGLGTDVPASASSDDVDRKMWIDRYLGVCYPLQDIRVTSPYGYRKDPFTGKRKLHSGLDLHARSEEVLAMMEGVVVKVGQDKTSGKYVTLRHGNYTVSYCHLSKICTVKGATVRSRDVVGITGSTGRSTGEHLHITCKLNGKHIDPMLMLNHIKAIQQECITALAAL